METANPVTTSVATGSALTVDGLPDIATLGAE